MGSVDDSVGLAIDKAHIQIQRFANFLFCNGGRRI